MGALLTEPEVAERLRCSTSKVKRLRRQRRLAYIPGRPVLIDEDDLLAYLDDVKQAKIERAEREAAERAVRESPEWKAQQARLLARKIWTLRKLRQK
ncbi:excisionase family DNA binding protein [Rhodoblastus acidophilus]|uniref:helix-turn-helix domain-containing protein n=1 Tax=Rhodoblastus acidophilus TaxID=1074 RepID=UPI002225003C|nr:helix-turn-helix domain-containing protein [Rhodoblastus acidophilus]MCW2317217.1 excisionase family DNA binding protein [Rhodoblastus acidophilus]